MIAFREALEFQTKVGRAAIEQRSRALATQLMAGLAKLPGIKNWTSPVRRAARRGRVVPAGLARRRTSSATALYRRTRSASPTRGGQDRAGLRASPHFYNSPAEVDRLVAALGRISQDGRVTLRGSASKVAGSHRVGQARRPSVTISIAPITMISEPSRRRRMLRSWK